MSKSILLTILTLLIFKVSFGQFIYKGGEQFPATQTWKFKLTNYSWTSENGIELIVGKNKLGGYLLLAIEVPFDEVIGGSVFMILEDGKSVNLATKVVTDLVDSKAQALYSITPNQIEQLKTSNISKIRFTIKDVKTKTVGGVTGNFTATNEVDHYSYDDKPKTWPTASDIRSLFEAE